MLFKGYGAKVGLGNMRVKAENRMVTVQAADDDNVYHIYRKKKVPDLLILLVMMNKISESI